MTTPHSGGEHGPDCKCGDYAEHPDHCHRTAALPCPQRFETLSNTCLLNVFGDGDFGRFTSALLHLHDMNTATSAYFTWLALVARWAAPSPIERHDLLRKRVEDMEMPPDATPQFRRMAELTTQACSSAIGGTWDGARDAIDAARADLDMSTMVTFLASVCASASLACSVARADPIAIRAYHVLGSQMRSNHALRVLPDLVAMVEAQTGRFDTPKRRSGTAALERLTDSDTRDLMVATELVSRAVGQLTADEVVMMTHAPTPDGGELGMLDWRNEHPSAEGFTSSVWAMRCADAQVRHAGDRDALAAALTDMVEKHPHGPSGFVVDVIVGGTQMLAYMIDPSSFEPATS